MSDDVILAIGTDRFPQALFATLHRALGIRHLVAYRYGADPAASVRPMLAESAGDDETMRRMIRIYSEGHHRRDPLRDHLGPAAGRTVSIHHLDAADIADDIFRRDLYLSQRMAGKTAVLVRHAGGALVLSLLRGEEAGPLCDRQRDFVERSAPILAAALERHLDLVGRPAEDGWELRLRRVAAATPLSARERHVCCRILDGWLNEGIALDLGLSVHSVVTYRRRAFAKLGVGTQNELFNLVVRGRAH